MARPSKYAVGLGTRTRTRDSDVRFTSPPIRVHSETKFGLDYSDTPTIMTSSLQGPRAFGFLNRMKSSNPDQQHNDASPTSEEQSKGKSSWLKIPLKAASKTGSNNPTTRSFGSLVAQTAPSHGMGGMFSTQPGQITPMVQHMSNMIAESRHHSRRHSAVRHRPSFELGPHSDGLDGNMDTSVGSAHQTFTASFSDKSPWLSDEPESLPATSRPDYSPGPLKCSPPGLGESWGATDGDRGSETPLMRSFPFPTAAVGHPAYGRKHTVETHLTMSDGGRPLIKARRLPKNTLYDNSPATAPVWMRDDDHDNFSQCLNMEHEAHDIQHLLNPFMWKTAVRSDLRSMTGYIVIDLGEVDDFRLGVYELIRHCRRVRHFDEINTPGSIRPVVLVQPPGIWAKTKEHLKNFIATFPNVFYFKGTLSSNCNDVSLSDTLNSNPNLRYCLEKASVVIVLKQKTSTVDKGRIQEGMNGMPMTSGQCHEDHMVDGPSVALASRLAKHLPHKQTRLVLELSLRDNFVLVKNSLKTETRKASHGMNRFGYIYNRSYQQGAVLTDTFVDIALGQAYLSGCGRDLIKVYSQLLSISDGKYISQGYSQANGFIGSIRITSALYKTIAEHAGKSTFHMTLGLITYDDACKYVIEVLYALPVGLLFDYRSRKQAQSKSDASSRRTSAATTSPSTKGTSNHGTGPIRIERSATADSVGMQDLNAELDGTVPRKPRRSSSKMAVAEAKFRRASEIHLKQLTKQGRASVLDWHRDLDPNKATDPLDTQSAVLCNPPMMTPVKPGDWLYLIHSPCPLPTNQDDVDDVLDDNEGLTFTDYRTKRSVLLGESDPGQNSNISSVFDRPSRQGTLRGRSVLGPKSSTTSINMPRTNYSPVGSSGGGRRVASAAGSNGSRGIGGSNGVGSLGSGGASTTTIGGLATQLPSVGEDEGEESGNVVVDDGDGGSQSRVSGNGGRISPNMIHQLRMTAQRARTKTTGNTSGDQMKRLRSLKSLSKLMKVASARSSVTSFDADTPTDAPHFEEGLLHPEFIASAMHHARQLGEPLPDAGSSAYGDGADGGVSRRASSDADDGRRSPRRSSISTADADHHTGPTDVEREERKLRRNLHGIANIRDSFPEFDLGFEVTNAGEEGMHGDSTGSATPEHRRQSGPLEHRQHAPRRRRGAGEAGEGRAPARAEEAAKYSPEENEAEEDARTALPRRATLQLHMPSHVEQTML